MKCREARGLFQRFIDGELSSRVAQRLSAHVEACASCRVALDQRRQLTAAAAQFLSEEAAAPAGLPALIQARLSGQGLPARPRFASPVGARRRYAMAGLAVAGAAVAIVVVLSSARTPQRHVVTAPAAVVARPERIVRPAAPAAVAVRPERVVPPPTPARERTPAAISRPRKPVVRTTPPTVPRPAAEKPALGIAPGRAVAVKPTPEPLFAVIAARQPATDGAGHALQVGDRLPAGASVNTGKGGRLTLITRRASEFTLNQDSELALDSRESARLGCGEIYCRSREHEFAAITTAGGKIALLGTAVDAALQERNSVAVTVVEGKVQLANDHGAEVLSAGSKAILVASGAPGPGTPVNVAAETAWYDGRGEVVSDYGQIAYVVQRPRDPILEIWTMNEDGSGRSRVKTYLGSSSGLGPWLAQDQVLFVGPSSLRWTVPDPQGRRPQGRSGAWILGLPPDGREWLLNAATGVDAPLALPDDFRINHMALSPDSARLLIEGGIRNAGFQTWTYDLFSGQLRLLTDAHTLGGTRAWTPDGSMVAMALVPPSPGHTTLSLVDTRTGTTTDLGLDAKDVSISPDGRFIAFTSDFAPHTGNIQGSVWVVAIEPGSQPLRISPAGEGAHYPSWSPDGTRIVYWAWPPRPTPDPNPNPDTMVRVAAADGSGSWEIYRGKVRGIPYWTPLGDAIFVRTKENILVVAPEEGWGIIATLGVSAADSVLPATQENETRQAVAAIREAVSSYAWGNWLKYCGAADASRAAFQRAAELFASLPWSYPRADLSVSNVALYVDAARALAEQPPDQATDEACRTHLAQIGWLLSAHREARLPDPASLAELLTWARTRNLVLHDWLWTNRDDLSPMARCPLGDPYVYQPAIEGRDGATQQGLLACPRHARYEFHWPPGGWLGSIMGLVPGSGLASYGN